MARLERALAETGARVEAGRAGQDGEPACPCGPVLLGAHPPGGSAKSHQTFPAVLLSPGLPGSWGICHHAHWSWEILGSGMQRAACGHERLVQLWAVPSALLSPGGLLDSGIESWP